MAFTVYWQPGCTSCLKVKEFLRTHGIEFESVNVREVPGAFEALARLGARSVPVVAQDGRFVHGQDIAAVARDTGLGKDTLRVWERRYGFPAPLRDAAGERSHHVGARDVLLLGHRRHRQVVFHQPRDEVGILRRQGVVAAEAARVARAEQGMVAAPALREVVKQPGEEQHLAPLEVRHQARAQRVLVRVLRLGEPAQVADHHQDVLVDRVHVEQVVLHLPDDAAERRQVVPEDVVEVHAPQLVDDAAGRAEELDEALPVRRVLAERGVDAVAVAPQRAQRPRRHAGQLAVALHEQEGVEHRAGPPREHALVANVQELVDRLELVVDRDRRRGDREQPRVQVLQQDRAHLPHQPRGAVVALHQLLARAPGRRVFVAQLPRERRLLVEHEPVLPPPGEVMQAHAQRADHALLARNGTRLGHRHQPGARELRPGSPESRCARDPDDRLEVAQAAGTLLDVGLEAVRRLVVLRVALLLLEHLRPVVRLAVDDVDHRAREGLEVAPRACDKAGLEHRRQHCHVARRFLVALLQRAHAVAGREPQVPQQPDQVLDRRAVGRVGRLLQQDQDVDVGVREQFAPAVAADGDQRGAPGDSARFGDLAQQVVGGAGKPVQQRVDRAAGVELRDEGVAFLPQPVAQLDHDDPHC